MDQPECDVISLCHTLPLGLCHTDAPTGKKGWHHIVSAREEEESIDFGEKTAVSASWNIIKQLYVTPMLAVLISLWIQMR